MLTPQSTIRSIARNASFAFAHEAPIWDPETDRVWFSSNDGGKLGFSGWDKNNVVGYVEMGEVEMAVEWFGEGDLGAVEVKVHQVRLFLLTCVL